MRFLGKFILAGCFAGGAIAVAAERDSTEASGAADNSGLTHAGKGLPDGVIVWDGLVKSAEASVGQEELRFTFNFKNESGEDVAILKVLPSCGCTTAQLPALPWRLVPGSGGTMPITMNLAGKSGSLVKTINVVTDKGSQLLTLRVTIPQPEIRTLTDAERSRSRAVAEVDRQAVFKNDCASCHVVPGKGKYGKELFDAVCAICHEGEHRASMVPDLHHLKSPTNDEFWQLWITKGKPGSLMPAFSTAEGGPLNEMQIATLVAYLNAAIPPRTPPPAK